MPWGCWWLWSCLIVEPMLFPVTSCVYNWYIDCFSRVMYFDSCFFMVWFWLLLGSTVLALKLPLRHLGLALQCWSNGIAHDLGWGGMICFESCQSRSACWGFYTTYSVHFLAYSVSFSCQMGAPIRHLHLMRFSSWGLHPFSSVLEGSSFCWDLIASLIRAGICCVQGVLWLRIIQFMLDWNQVCNSKSFSLNYLFCSHSCMSTLSLKIMFPFHIFGFVCCIHPLFSDLDSSCLHKGSKMLTCFSLCLVLYLATIVGMKSFLFFVVYLGFRLCFLEWDGVLLIGSVPHSSILMIL
jgi:hypothetical protein